MRRENEPTMTTHDEPDPKTSPRRVFLHAALTGAAATTLLGVGCGDDGETGGSGGAGGQGAGGQTSASTSASGATTSTAGATTSSTSGQGGEGGAAASTASAGGGGGAGGATPACEETEDDIEGPFYKDGAPFVDGALTGLEGLPGLLLQLSGRVLSSADCQPIEGAVLDIWQADDDGAYDNVGFVLRGKVRTDAEGRYEVSTIVPGHYLNGNQFRPAHIHVKASADGHVLLTTQLYFPDDPYNEIDPWFDPLLLVAITQGEGLDFGAFDFTLAAT